MSSDTQLCPSCHKNIPICIRHPKYICRDCLQKYPSLNEEGKEVIFSNASWSGGFISRVKGSDILEENHVCYINGIKCWADEYRFGGIVIEALE